MEKLLGDGASGRVLGCRRIVSGDFVAVKVFKATRRQTRFAVVEAETLRELERCDVEKCRRFCIRLLDTFVHAGENECLVFEPLALSLRELAAKAGRSPSLLLADIRTIGAQLLAGLGFMHSAGFAHTDIKCTNIMLRNCGFELVPHPRAPGKNTARPHQPCEAVLIDFGCALRPGVQSQTGELGKCRPGARHVRAPEIVLGLAWKASVDLWSLGTLLISLYTGERLFRVHEDVEHLAAMQRICGAPIPHEMAREVAPRIAERGVAFDSATGRVIWPERPGDAEAKQRIKETPTLKACILPRHGEFLAFMQDLLALDPRARGSADWLLRRSFFKKAEISE